jgi:WD40 repeat protein
LEPYRNSPWDWWAWIRAVRERRAGGIVSEYNREKLGLLFGQEAKFGFRWARNELTNFLNERDRQRASPSKEQQRSESEAEGLLSAVKNAYVLATAPRLALPRTVAGFPSYLLDYAKHPDNRLTVFSVASILLAASAAFVMFSVWQQSLAQEEADRAIFLEKQEANKKVIEATQGERDRPLASRHHFAAQADDRLITDGQIERAGLVALTATKETKHKPEGKLRQSMAAIAVAQGGGPLLLGTDASTSLIGIAPDGKFIAGVPLATDTPGAQTDRVWDTVTGATISSLVGVLGDITRLVISADGQLVAAGSSLGEIVVWNVKSGDVVAQLNHNNAQISALVFSQNGARLISGAVDYTVRLWDIGKKTVLQTLTINETCPTDEVSQWVNTEERDLSRKPAIPADSGDPNSGGIVAAAINVDETRVLASTSRLRLVVWDVTSGNCLRNHAMDRRIQAIEFGSIPSFAIVSIRQRGTYATRLSLTDDKVEFQFTKLKFLDSESVTSINFDGKAKQFLLATSNGAVIARESETGTAGPGESSRDSEAVANAGSVRSSTAALEAPANPITESIHFIRKMGYRLVTMSATAGWSIVQADYDEKHPLQAVQWTFDPIDSASKTDFFEDRVVDAVSDDRRYVAVASDNIVEIRQLDGQKKYTPLIAGGKVHSLCFDPASRYLVIGLDNGDVLLSSFKEGRTL